MPARTIAAAAVAAAVPVVALLCAAAAIAAVAVWQLLVGLGIVLAFVLGPAVYAACRAAFGRRPGTALEGAVAAVPELERLVAEEAAAHGLEAPPLRIAAGRDVAVLHAGDAHALSIGVAALAERGPAQVWVAVGEALVRDADGAGRLLRRLRDGVLARALSVAEERPIASLPWRAHPRLAARLVDAALRERALACDAILAARHGSAALAAHVRATARRETFEWYWGGWVAPCLDAGFHPPIAEGWRRWLATPSAHEAFSADVTFALAAEPQGEEPRMADRLAAVAGHARALDADSHAVGDPGALEAAVLASRAPGARLVAIDWERMPAAVIVPELRKTVAAGPGFGTATVADLCELAARAEDEDEADALAAALTVAVAGAGWEIEHPFGEGLRAVGDDGELQPFSLVGAAAAGEVEPEGWRAFAARTGIAELPLSAPPVAPDELAALAAAPAAGRLELALAGSRGLRRRALAVVIPALLLALPLAGLTVAAAVGPGFTTGVRAFLWGMAAALAGSAALWAWLRLRLAFSSGTVTIAPDALRIEHPGLLKRPFEVPRAQLRAAVAEATSARDEQGRPARFAIADSPWADPGLRGDGVAGHLWTGGLTPVAPLLTAPGETPSLALVFTEPVLAPLVRHRRLDAPQRGEGIAGLLLSVAAPERARSELAALGFAPALTFEDAAVLIAALGLEEHPVAA